MTGVAHIADVDLVRWVNGRVRQRRRTAPDPERSLPEHGDTSGLHRRKTATGSGDVYRRVRYAGEASPSTALVVASLLEFIRSPTAYKSPLTSKKEAAMRFQVEMFDADVPSLLNRLLEITGFDPWSRKFAALQRQLNENEFLRYWQLEHHGIELRFRDLLAEQVRTGAVPIRIQDPLHYSLCAFACGLVHMHAQLSDFGKNRLRGMLLDGLKPDNNLLAVQHEITTAVHFVSLGFDIEPHDIEKGAGVDFIARKDGAELEVECKMFTGDLGRKVHSRKALMLHKHLSETIAHVYRSAQTGIAMRITVPDRLTCQPSQLAAIASTVSRGLLSGTAITQTADCEVQVVDFPVSSSPFTVDHPSKLSRTAVDDFAQTCLGRANRELMVMFSPGKRAVLALIESARSDEVLTGMYRQLREASRAQFTRTRPGHLAVQLQDLGADQMADLAWDDEGHGKPSGLQVMTTKLLQSENRTHIHSVAYRSHGSMQRPPDHPNAIMESGIGTFIRNPSNPHYNDARLRPLH